MSASRAMTPRDIPLSCIKDGGAQMRVEMNPDIINEYAEAMLNGAVFPPIIIYFDGTDYWPGDGYHRIEAARKIERYNISAEVREGSARDAILCGIGSNATHGLRRTQADKRRAVENLLTDPEWARWSDRKIARGGQGRSQDGRENSPRDEWGNPRRQDEWGNPQAIRQAERLDPG